MRIFSPSIYKLAAFLLTAITVAGCQNNPNPGKMNKKNIPPPYFEVNGKPFDVQAHRGGRGLTPENSIYGFLNATDMGVTTLEMDVVVSADHYVVVSHDPYFDPGFCLDTNGQPLPAGNPVYLYQLPYAEIRKYDCGSKPYPRFPLQKKVSTHKPLLSDVIQQTATRCIETGRPAVLYNIEIKSTVEDENAGRQPATPELFVKIVLDTLRDLLPYDRYTIQSFDPRILESLEKFDPEVRKVYLVEDTVISPETFDAPGFRPDVASPDYHLLSPELIGIYQSKGYKVIPWTVNTRKDMKMLIDWGVDGIISDYPDSLLEVVRSN